MQLFRLCYSGLLVLTCAVVLAASASAQSMRTLSDNARISLLTILPGDAIYSIYGHSALRVYDPAQDLDWSFNYGTFDFTPFFAFTFAYGELDYMLSVSPFSSALRAYRMEERPVIEQVLNLSPQQRQALFRFLQINALPENRVYRYDFFFDNCSTRIRDALSETLSGSIRLDLNLEERQTFRELISPYQGSFLDFGLDVLLGAPTDREAAPWEMMFLPDYLLQAANASTIEIGGSTRPLVARQDTLFWVEGYTHARATVPRAILVMWSLLVLWLGVTLWQYRRGHTPPRLPDVLLLATAGGVGLVILFLWLISLHEVVGPNWNLLWAWPTHVVAAGALARRRRSRWLQRYLQIASVVALVTAGGWLIWPQALPAPALPLVLLLALRTGWYGYVEYERVLLPSAVS